MNKIAKVFVVFVVLCFCASSVFAITESSNKVVNKNAVLSALAGYNQQIQADPNSIDAYINRAYLYYLLGNVQEAIADYDKIISISPKNEEFYLNRGYLKHISNNREGALKD